MLPSMSQDKRIQGRIESWYREHWPSEYEQWTSGPAKTSTIRICATDRDSVPEYIQSVEVEQLTDEKWEQYYDEMLERHVYPLRYNPRTLPDLVYTYIPYVDDPEPTNSEGQSYLVEQYVDYREQGGRHKFQRYIPALEEGDWLVDYNYIRPSKLSLRNPDYREWYQQAHPAPTSLEQALVFWINRRRQLERCQVIEPNSFEAYLSASQHMAWDDTWDNGQIYRLFTKRVQAAAILRKRKVTEEDIDDYLIWSDILNRHHRFLRLSHTIAVADEKTSIAEDRPPKQSAKAQGMKPQGMKLMEQWEAVFLNDT